MTSKQWASLEGFPKKAAFTVGQQDESQTCDRLGGVQRRSLIGAFIQQIHIERLLCAWALGWALGTPEKVPKAHPSPGGAPSTRVDRILSDTLTQVFSGDAGGKGNLQGEQPAAEPTLPQEERGLSLGWKLQIHFPEEMLSTQRVPRPSVFPCKGSV